MFCVALLQNKLYGYDTNNAKCDPLITLSRKTRTVILQNVGLAMGLKAVFLVTTVLGITGLWIAILADTGATVLVTANALRLLEVLCRPGLEEKLASHAPVRILVVDDEPLARRAVVGALQLAFKQPESADRGESEDDERPVLGGHGCVEKRRCFLQGGGQAGKSFSGVKERLLEKVRTSSG